MSRSAKRPCSYPGCGLLTEDGRCPRHVYTEKKEADERRGSASVRGYGRTWQKASKAFLQAHPVCQCDECKEGQLRLLPSQVVDHYVPHRGDMEIFWDRSNWRAMNKDCHDKKTAKQDGGFGNAPRGAGQFSSRFRA